MAAIFIIIRSVAVYCEALANTVEGYIVARLGLVSVLVYVAQRQLTAIIRRKHRINRI